MRDERFADRLRRTVRKRFAKSQSPVHAIFNGGAVDRYTLVVSRCTAQR